MQVPCIRLGEVAHSALVGVTAASVRADVQRQRVVDDLRSDRQVALHARMAGVVRAQAALVRRELGARPALRQALVDLAAISEALAAELPADAREDGDLENLPARFRPGRLAG